jgi:hypothetical protein
MSIATLAQRPVTRQQAMFFGLIGAGLLLLGVVSGAAIKAEGWLPFGGNENKVPIYVTADQRTNQALTLNTGFSAVAKAVTPAVVTVETQARTQPMPQMPFFGDPFDFFRRGFPGLPDDDDQQPRRRTPHEQASNRATSSPNFRASASRTMCSCATWSRRPRPAPRSDSRSFVMAQSANWRPRSANLM